MKAKRGNIDRIVASIRNRKSEGLKIAVALVKDQAKALVKVGKYPAGSGMVGGTTRNSIYGVVEGDVGKIGTNVEWGAALEFGAHITPLTAQALTVPISPAAYGKRAGDFNDLFMLKRDGKPPLLVRKKGEGIEVMYVLLKSVEISKQPFLRPALDEKRQEVKRILQRA